MPGSHAQGLKAAITNKTKYGDDYYSRMGKLGGSVIGKPKGFASMPRAKALEASARGGRISRRGKAVA